MDHQRLMQKEPTRRAIPTRLIAVAAIACVTLTTGCAGLRQRREEVKESGFLGDYSKLAKNDKYPAYLVYVNPKATWSKYDSIIVDSVALYGVDPKLSAEDRDAIAGMMYNALTEKLGERFILASSNGPSTLRLRAAITEAQGSKVVLNVITSVIPQMRMPSTLIGMGADTAMLVGEAGGELEIVDSSTNERLMAGVDRQTGTKALIRGGSKFSTWGDVQEACTTWATNIAKALADNGVRQKPGAKK